MQTKLGSASWTSEQPRPTTDDRTARASRGVLAMASACSSLVGSRRQEPPPRPYELASDWGAGGSAEVAK
jgi:hypothetical protein